MYRESFVQGRRKLKTSVEPALATRRLLRPAQSILRYDEANLSKHLRSFNNCRDSSFFYIRYFVWLERKVGHRQDETGRIIPSY